MGFTPDVNRNYPVIKNLQTLMEKRGFNQRRLALAAGLNETAVRDMFVGKSDDPRFGTIVKLAAVLGCSVESFLIGDEANNQASSQDHDNSVGIPLLPVEASAGGGRASELIEKPDDFIFFNKDWLWQAHRLRPKGLYVFPVSGDSMSPSIKDGDLLLVDSTENGKRLSDGVFVFRYDGDIFVKRLQRVPGQGLKARSDNDIYEVFTINPTVHDFTIFGKVVYVVAIRGI